MKNKFFLSLFFFAAFISVSHAQVNTSFLTNLCQRWQLDAIEIKESGKKFPPDKKMQKNYLQFRPNGEFSSMETGIAVKGKWRADELEMKLVTYDFENQNLTSPVTFDIISLTKTNLAISTSPVSGNQVIMHYVARKSSKKSRK